MGLLRRRHLNGGNLLDPAEDFRSFDSMRLLPCPNTFTPAVATGSKMCPAHNTVFNAVEMRCINHSGFVNGKEASVRGYAQAYGSTAGGRGGAGASRA